MFGGGVKDAFFVGKKKARETESPHIDEAVAPVHICKTVLLSTCRHRLSKRPTRLAWKTQRNSHHYVHSVCVCVSRRGMSLEETGVKREQHGAVISRSGGSHFRASSSPWWHGGGVPVVECVVGCCGCIAAPPPNPPSSLGATVHRRHTKQRV